jgi:hypothetical protein
MAHRLEHGRVCSWYEAREAVHFVHSAYCRLAVVIGLCPSFAVLLRAARLATKKTSQNGQGYVKQDGAGFNLQTIGSHSTRKKTRGHNADLTETFWSDTHSSQEELAGKPSEIHVSTTIQQQSQNFGPGK